MRIVLSSLDDKETNMILETIRKCMQESELTRYRIHKESGVDQTVLHRIAHGGGCSIQTADKICEFLGLELTKRDKEAK